MSIYFTLLQSQWNSLINPRLWRWRNNSIPFIKILQCPLSDFYHLISFGKVISSKNSWKRISWIKIPQVAKCLAFLSSEIHDLSWLSQVSQECLSPIVDLTNLITSLPFFHLHPLVLHCSHVQKNMCVHIGGVVRWWWWCYLPTPRLNSEGSEDISLPLHALNNSMFFITA